MRPEGEPLLSPDQFTQLMEAITAAQTPMDEKFSEFQVEVRQGMEEAAAKALKRARYEKPYTFKRKGNEEQATFNAKLDETVADVESELTEAGPAAAPALQRAMEAIKKGRKTIAERQKLIKIAERSELGWGVVAEYTSDELAEDSDDEKRLERAEKAAEQKAANGRNGPLVCYWRARGLRILVYLDDGLCAVSGAQAAQEASQLVKSTIDKAGIIAHPEESIWQPTQRLIWLGFVV